MVDRSVANEIIVQTKERKPFSIMRLITNEYFLYGVSLVAFFSIWHYVAATKLLGKSLATPYEVVLELIRMTHLKLAGKTLWGHIWASAHRILIGFSLGALIGVPLGLFMALNRYVNAFVKPVFDLFKPMPPIAWISIAILWFGIGEPSKVFIIFIGSLVPCLLNAYNGIRIIDEELYDVVRVLGGNRWQEIIQVSFPAALPAVGPPLFEPDERILLPVIAHTAHRMILRIMRLDSVALFYTHTAPFVNLLPCRYPAGCRGVPLIP